MTWPHISDELQFFSRLLQTGSEWTISKMTNSIVGIAQWVVTDHTVVSFEDAKAREAVVKEQRASLAAMKKASGLIGHKASGRDPRRRGNKRKPETEDALRAQARKNEKKGGEGKTMPSSDSAGSAETDEETSCDEHWSNILTTLRKKAFVKQKLWAPEEGPPAGRATGGPSAGDETREPLADDETRRPIGGRRAARALEAHGLATLAEVRSHGVLVGFGITCRCHNNVDDRPGVICKRELPLGNPPMSHVEAKLRLKRWYVAGSQETWDPHTARTSHIKFGGRNLRDLDSRAEGWATITEWDLSDMARRRGAP